MLIIFILLLKQNRIFIIKTKFHIMDQKRKFLWSLLMMELLKYLNHQSKIVYFSYLNILERILYYDLIYSM